MYHLIQEVLGTLILTTEYDFMFKAVENVTILMDKYQVANELIAPVESLGHEAAEAYLNNAEINLFLWSILLTFLLSPIFDYIMKIAIENTTKITEKQLQRLKNLGEIVIYGKNISTQEFLDAVKECEVILVNKEFHSDIIKQLSVKMISVWGTGYDAVDINAATEQDIIVCNVPGYSTDSVAEHIFALLFELVKKVSLQQQIMKEGKWNLDAPSIMELKAKTIGIIGYGDIGKKTAQIAKAFDMQVLVMNRSQIKDDAVKQVDLNHLLQESDFVSISVPLNEKTKGMITKEDIALMKPSAYLINCARGAIINEQDLYEALQEKMIAGAALDVFSYEPLPQDHQLRTLKNVILTPHTAFYTKEAVERLSDICIDNIEGYVKGEIRNQVN